ncbi:hypothetical protein COV19_03795 [Candidatus Woesearchaeota archaeon CG10_big_fil_rev_8_21_14_0_10_44_13]|nr:MAG: hypothetical protein COV19_03795 [Candidatus Woesearchaeota archaeon CG10_big_fil_rev_8_21_14_0_10_44_13]
MIEEVKRDILNILQETLDAFKKEDYVSLRDISNHTLHNASIIQDEYSISIAVIIFSIYKIASRSEGREKDVCAKIIKALNEAQEILKSDNTAGYGEAVKRIFKAISDTDKRSKFYVEEVINQAEIKKGSKLYEHGISLARAADLLGISQWELMSYVGKTVVPEAEAEISDVRDRINFTKSLFGT